MCLLETLNFEGPSNLTTIGDDAFIEAYALTSVTIPASVETIGTFAFAYASLGDLIFESPSKLTTIGEYAFYGTTSLTSVEIPASVETNPASFLTIGDYAFANAEALTSVTIPATVETIGDYAFAYDHLLDTLIFESPSNLTTIGDYAFTDAWELTSVTIPASIVTIGDYAFAYANVLDDLTFESPSNLTTIGEAAFIEAYELTSVTIPASVDTVGDYAFANAELLSSVHFLGFAPALANMGAGVFEGVASGARAYVGLAAASSFELDDELKWNGLTVETGVYLVVYDSNGGSSVASDSFATGGSISETKLSGQFEISSSVLTKALKTKIWWMVAKSGKKGNFTITATAGKIPGATDSQVKALAKKRGQMVAAYLVKLGVPKSNITIKVKITNRGIVSKTKIIARHLAS